MEAAKVRPSLFQYVPHIVSGSPSPPPFPFSFLSFFPTLLLFFRGDYVRPPHFVLPFQADVAQRPSSSFSLSPPPSPGGRSHTMRRGMIPKPLRSLPPWRGSIPSFSPLFPFLLSSLRDKRQQQLRNSYAQVPFLIFPLSYIALMGWGSHTLFFPFLPFLSVDRRLARNEKHYTQLLS